MQAWFAATLLKRDSNKGVFLWKFAKFLGTAFFTEHLQWLLLRLSGRRMLRELNWYVQTSTQVFSCEFSEIFKNIIDHLRWLLLSVTRCKTSKYTTTAAMGSLFDGKYSQWGDSLLPNTRAYLEPSRKSTMRVFWRNS